MPNNLNIGPGYRAQIKFSATGAVGGKSGAFALTNASSGSGYGTYYFLYAPLAGSALKIGSTYSPIGINSPADSITSLYLVDGSIKGGKTVGLICKSPGMMSNVACDWEVGKYTDANGVTRIASPGSSYFIQADLNTTPEAIDAVTNGYFSLYNSNETATTTQAFPKKEVVWQAGQNTDIASLLKLIEELKKQIADLQGQVVTDNSLPNETTSFSYNWQNPLYVGMKNNEDVRALQNALLLEKVYTGPVTGNFGPLTLVATRAFQEKYGITPVTGFVGDLTRAKLNSLY